MAKKIQIVIAAVIFMMIGAIFSVAQASATTTTESGYAHSEVTSVAFKLVQQKGWIGLQEHIRIQKVPKSQCGWYKNFLNSDYLVGETSQKPQMYPDHHGYLCPDKYSPTGWVKRGGGHTGSDCGNIAAPPFVKPKFPVVKPPVTEVNSTSHLKVKVKVEVNAAASISRSCGTANGTGFAYDLIEVRYSTYVKSTHSQSLKLRLAAKVIAKAEDTAKATAEVQCSSSPPPPPCNCTTPEEPCGCTPPPPKHWTEISCTGFEEISGGGSFLVDCGVSDDNGAPISLEAHSNNGNSRVSGINCFSNGGSQTCPSGGTFEFRVSGINNGSSILSSSITATASANGVKATFTSDPFPVDPSEGGF